MRPAAGQRGDPAPRACRPGRARETGKGGGEFGKIEKWKDDAPRGGQGPRASTGRDGRRVKWRFFFSLFSRSDSDRYRFSQSPWAFIRTHTRPLHRIACLPLLFFRIVPRKRFITTVYDVKRIYFFIFFYCYRFDQ